MEADHLNFSIRQRHWNVESTQYQMASDMSRIWNMLSMAWDVESTKPSEEGPTVDIWEGHTVRKPLQYKWHLICQEYGFTNKIMAAVPWIMTWQKNDDPGQSSMKFCLIFSSNTLLFEHLFCVWNLQCKEGVVVVWDMSEYWMQDIGYGWLEW